MKEWVLGEGFLSYKWCWQIPKLTSQLPTDFQDWCGKTTSLPFPVANRCLFCSGQSSYCSSCPAHWCTGVSSTSTLETIDDPMEFFHWQPWKVKHRESQATASQPLFSFLQQKDFLSAVHPASICGLFHGFLCVFYNASSPIAFVPACQFQKPSLQSYCCSLLQPMAKFLDVH